LQLVVKAANPPHKTLFLAIQLAESGFSTSNLKGEMKFNQLLAAETIKDVYGRTDHDGITLFE
jgi:hypothetical protein